MSSRFLCQISKSIRICPCVRSLRHDSKRHHNKGSVRGRLTSKQIQTKGNNILKEGVRLMLLVLRILINTGEHRAFPSFVFGIGQLGSKSVLQ